MTARGQYRQVERIAPNGARVTTWERAMPRIQNRLLNSVVYMYPSRPAAEAGGKSGGSGFLVATITPDQMGTILHVVTCKHVIQSPSSAPVARIPNHWDGTQIVETLRWRVGSGDVAVAPFMVLTGAFTETNPSNYEWIPRAWFATPEDVEPDVEVIELLGQEREQRPDRGPRSSGLHLRAWSGAGSDSCPHYEDRVRQVRRCRECCSTPGRTPASSRLPKTRSPKSGNPARLGVIPHD